jgi:uncharacterized protein (TIGR03086 family)
MSDDVLDIYRNGLDFFESIVQGVPGGAWQRPSPCAGWTALDVLGHVGQATSIGAQIVRGETVVPSEFDPPSTAVDGDPAFWWVQQATPARAVLDEGIDLDLVVDSPMGRRSVREGLAFPAADLYMHGWDLGAATGNAVEIPDEAIAFINALFEKIPEEMTRRPGVFGPAVASPDGATATQVLMAFAGRDPGHP